MNAGRWCPRRRSGCGGASSSSLCRREGGGPSLLRPQRAAPRSRPPPRPPPPLAWGYHSAASVRRMRGARARAVAAERACCARRRGTAAGFGPPHTLSRPPACSAKTAAAACHAQQAFLRAHARVAAALPLPPRTWPAAEGPRPLQIRLVCLLLLLQHCWRCAAAPMHANQAVPSSQRSRQCCRTQG